jgi:hypothetical protein
LEQAASALSQALINQALIGEVFGQASIAAWSFMAIAVFALGLTLYFAIRARTRQVDLERAVQTFQSLDIEAFGNLVDSDEEAFLRANLPPTKFREIKRQRSWAALMYAWEAGRAASGLAKFGQAAQRSPDPKIAASGFQIAENAFRLRLQTIRACFYLLTEILFPDQRRRARPQLVDQYERTSETLLRLTGFSSGRHAVARSKSA